MLMMAYIINVFYKLLYQLITFLLARCLLWVQEKMRGRGTGSSVKRHTRRSCGRWIWPWLVNGWLTLVGTWQLIPSTRLLVIGTTHHQWEVVGGEYDLGTWSGDDPCDGGVHQRGRAAGTVDQAKMTFVMIPLHIVQSYAFSPGYNLSPVSECLF